VRDCCETIEEGGRSKRFFKRNSEAFPDGVPRTQVLLTSRHHIEKSRRCCASFLLSLLTLLAMACLDPLLLKSQAFFSNLIHYSVQSPSTQTQNSTKPPPRNNHAPRSYFPLEAPYRVRAPSLRPFGKHKPPRSCFAMQCSRSTTGNDQRHAFLGACRAARRPVPPEQGRAFPQ
jgi:hypothetical protein